MPTEVGPEIHKGDVGVNFILALVDQNGDPVDLSTGSPTVKINFKSPAGVFNSYTAAVVVPGTLGKIEYATSASDATFDTETGSDWQVQGYVTFGAEQIYYSSIVKFVVHENLEA